MAVFKGPLRGSLRAPLRGPLKGPFRCYDGKCDLILVLRFWV